MPWVHLHVGFKGKVNACCVANIPFGNINNQSLKEIWEGEAINKLRERFRKGESDNRCGVCMSVEKGGGKSIRQETLEKFGKDFNEDSRPIYFDIRFSNLCNYTCRTCWHGASSSWFEEAKKLKNNVGNQAIIKNVSDYDRLLQDLGADLKLAKEIYFAGGEPLIMEEHSKLLLWLKENNPNIHLRYNTNLSTLQYKQVDFLKEWESFNHVEVMASIDDVGDNGVYIRRGMNWDKTLRLLERIQGHSSVQLIISPTISILNANSFPELVEELSLQLELTENQWYLNFLERPYNLNIQAFPIEKKRVVSDKYNSFSSTFPFARKLQEEILVFMQSKDLSEKFLP